MGIEQTVQSYSSCSYRENIYLEPGDQPVFMIVFHRLFSLINPYWHVRRLGGAKITVLYSEFDELIPNFVCQGTMLVPTILHLSWKRRHNFSTGMAPVNRGSIQTSMELTSGGSTMYLILLGRKSHSEMAVGGLLSMIS